MQIKTKLGRYQWAGKCQGQLSSFKHPMEASNVNATARRKRNNLQKTKS